jgi:site-specific DNA-methyltransferase (adenine-specific)
MEITSEDNMELMARYEDNHFDLAIVDPPYGIGCNLKGGSSSTGKNGWSGAMKKANEWNELPTKEYFEQLFRVSKNQIIWGGNYMTDFLNPSQCWLLWDKGQRDFSLADGEMAWTSFNKAMRIFTMPRATAMQDAKNNGGKIHATQKPVKLYEWLLMNYAKEGDKILDTHLGSGSIALACHNLKYDLTACELDTEYFNAAMKRLKEHQQQLTIF